MSPVQPELSPRHLTEELALAAKYARVVRDVADARLRRAVVAASSAGMSQRRIAEVLGCSQPEVHRILRRAAADDQMPAPQTAKPVARSRRRFLPSSPLGTLLVTHRTAVLDIAARHHASNVRVFGSVARGEDDDRSDIDLLADFDEDANPLDEVAMAREIEELLGAPVDVGPANSLRPRLRDEVLSEAVAL